MPNYGFTTITVRGPESARTDLREELASTARGPLEFTLVAAAPDVWKGDNHLREATIESAEGMLVLRTCLPWDQDALPLCGSLAGRYPTLGFDGYFYCEGTWPDFTVNSYANGRQAYQVDFAAQFRAYIHGQHPDTSRQCLVFYPKSPERDAAAVDFGPTWTGPFLARPPIAGSWRRSDYDAEAGVCYLRENAGGTATAVVFNADEGEGHVLSGVDPHGGYVASKALGLSDLRGMFPELAGEFGRTQQAQPPVSKLAAPAREPNDTDDLPF